MKKVAQRLVARRELREKSLHVAVASHESRIIAVATNDRTGGHAECRLIHMLESLQIASPVDVTVVRVANTSTSKNVAFKNSRPCRACREALLRTSLPVRTVSWSTEEGHIFVAKREDL